MATKMVAAAVFMIARFFLLTRKSSPEVRRIIDIKGQSKSTRPIYERDKRADGQRADSKRIIFRIGQWPVSRV